MSTVLELDRRHVWHPYTQHGDAPPPLVISRGTGAYLYDETGREIFDAISSWWVTLHGHAHPAIAAAIARQAAILEQVIFAPFTHEPASELAAALVERLPPGLTRVFFSDDGSTAVEVALKVALQYFTNQGEHRPLVAALDSAYHGDTFGAMSAGARGLFTDPFASHLFEVARLPDPSVDAPGCLAALDRLLDQRGEQVAALIVEPLLLGAGGMRMWDGATLRAMRERTKAAGVLLIADEVLTGFGRTGALFACSAAGVSPDIICLSKGLTGGFLPLGATVTTEAVFEAFRAADRRRAFFHGHSYTANPIACAAALASLALLDQRSADARDRIGHTHGERLARLARCSGVRHCRSLGTVAAFDLAGETGYLSPVGPELAAFALQRGVLLRPLGNVVYLLPPYCATTDDLDRAYNVIEAFLSRSA
ncbi:MAG TPA: adenosylmethionine--8-amino-7-oxononanoate transaminase [Gemmatimonadales bacterium]|nr:adenosylmethionine--8-amino-7-oxononanoate transaminase [Gemmatimonadales bacterium]